MKLPELKLMEANHVLSSLLCLQHHQSRSEPQRPQQPAATDEGGVGSLVIIQLMEPDRGMQGNINQGWGRQRRPGDG